MMKRIGALPLCLFALAATSLQAARMEFVPVDAGGPHLIDGNAITIVGGQEVTLEIKLSEWGPAGLHLFQSAVDMAGFTSGDSGTAYPLGWDRPLIQDPCQNDTDCPAGQVCFMLHHKCAGPDHDPEQGWFVTYERPDYVFQNDILLEAIDLLGYRLTDLVWETGTDPAYAAPPKYAGTLILDVSEDASGTFTVGFRPDGCFMMSPVYDRFPVDYIPVSITVVEPGCGNSVCELGESHNSCSADCERVTRVRDTGRFGD
ncbi:MAG: hypothetical protein PVI86_11720 [Phycisphaerae bacterium]|jgi:hypothetical protein